MYITPTLDSLKQDLNEARKNLSTISSISNSTKFKHISNVVDGYVNGEDFTKYTYINGATVYVMLSLRNLEGFKSERLKHILSAFNDFDPTSMATHDNATYMLRSYTFNYNMSFKDGVLGFITIVVDAGVKDDSTTCERVVVGMTEGKPQPIYKMVCNDQEELKEDEEK